MASEKITKFVEEVKTLTVMELAELVKAIEEEFGVSAAAPVMASTRAKASPSMEISLVSFPGPAAADTRDAA